MNNKVLELDVHLPIWSTSAMQPTTTADMPGGESSGLHRLVQKHKGASVVTSQSVKSRKVVLENPMQLSYGPGSGEAYNVAAEALRLQKLANGVINNAMPLDEAVALTQPPATPGQVVKKRRARTKPVAKAIISESLPVQNHDDDDNAETPETQTNAEPLQTLTYQLQIGNITNKVSHVIIDAESGALSVWAPKEQDCFIPARNAEVVVSFADQRYTCWSPGISIVNDVYGCRVTVFVIKSDTEA